ncbi:hypothetical protein [Streptomyces sp. NPDC050534]
MQDQDLRYTLPRLDALHHDESEPAVTAAGMRCGSAAAVTSGPT